MYTQKEDAEMTVTTTVRKALKIERKTQKKEMRKERIAREAPLSLFLGNFRYTTFLCTPKLKKELAVGYLLSEGIAKSLNEIAKIKESQYRIDVTFKANVEVTQRIEVAEHSRVLSTACGASAKDLLSLIEEVDVPQVETEEVIPFHTLIELPQKTVKRAHTYHATRGVHEAALFSIDGTMEAFAEDVGRHNAVDKVIGQGAMNRFSFRDGILVCSGRPTSDIVLKASRMKIPFLISFAMPTEWGVKLAAHANILLAMVRGQVYIFSEYNKVKTRNE